MYWFIMGTFGIQYVSFSLKPNKQWQIQWWRECSCDMVGIESGSLMLIDERDVVDLLWGDAKAQRQVRVRFPMLDY